MSLLTKIFKKAARDQEGHEEGSERKAFQGKKKRQHQSDGSARSGARWSAGGRGVAPDRVGMMEIAFLVLIFPFLVVISFLIALWIKLVSGGQVFFRQVRIGYQGQHFTINKFRTMSEGVPTETHVSHIKEVVENGLPMTKLDAEGDDRLIRGGAFLRSTGLDELPQLINVIRGEMSLVGPRPCLPEEYGFYSPAQRERFDVLPGLTGFWQVNGKNETTFSEMVALDLHYVRNRSDFLDMAVILKTPWAIMSQMRYTPGRRDGTGGESSDAASVSSPTAQSKAKVHPQIPPNAKAEH